MESTKNLSDVGMERDGDGKKEFMQMIGWTQEAEMEAEQASQHIMFPYKKWSCL